ncbi:MAG: ArsR/SmtB family transcription factor [Candidatus Nanosalina sp.]
MSEEKNLEETARIFQALGNRNRLRILQTLSGEEKCPHDIAEELDLTNSNISHHLKKLHERRIVERRKEGKHRYYQMSDEHIEEIIEAGVEHADE